MKVDMWPFEFLKGWLKGYSDSEIAEWLNARKVRILKNSGINVVNSIEFELAYDRETIEDFRSKFGENWGAEYVLLMKSVFINLEDDLQVISVGKLIKNLYETGFADRDPLKEINEVAVGVINAWQKLESAPYISISDAVKKYHVSQPTINKKIRLYKSHFGQEMERLQAGQNNLLNENQLIEALQIKVPKPTFSKLKKK